MEFHVQFPARYLNRFLLGLILFEVFLVLMYAVTILLEVPRPMGLLFDMDRETTIPTWFSSVQLLLIGILFLLSGHWSKKDEIVMPELLLVFGIGFIFLSADEASRIHEQISRVLHSVELIPMFKGNHGGWISIYFSIAAILVAIGFRTINSMRSVYRRQWRIILSGSVVLLIGAVGLEIISYMYIRRTEYMNFYHAEVALEEFLEMAGASIILYGTALCALGDSKTNGSKLDKYRKPI